MGTLTEVFPDSGSARTTTGRTKYVGQPSHRPPAIPSSSSPRCVRRIREHPFPNPVVAPAASLPPRQPPRKAAAPGGTPQNTRTNRAYAPSRERKATQQERNRERKTEDKKQVRNDHPPSQRTLSTPARRPSTTAATGRQTRSPGWPPASRHDRQMRPTTRRHPTTPTRPPPSPGAEGPWAYPPSWMTRIQKREQRGGGHDAEGYWKKGKTAAGETS